jgi:hypothetical protein
MNTQSVTVQAGDYSVTSSHEDEASMIASLSEAKPESKEPRVVKPIPDDPEEKSPLSKAASELGKKGGEAAAKARKEAAKEAKPAEKAEETDDEPATEEGKEKPLGKPRDDPRARMLEATRKEAEAKRERDAERARAERLERELAAERAARPAPPKPAAEPEKARPAEDIKPKADDFEDYEQFLDARDAYNRRQWERETEARAQVSARQRSVDSTVFSFNERLAGVKADNPEFAAKFHEFMGGVSPEVRDLQPSFMRAEGQRPDASHVIADEIIRSEHAPALMLHFTEHPEDLQRVKALRTPDDVKVEVRLIARGLEAATTVATSTEPEVSKAKPPVRPVTGSPHTADSEPDDDTPYDDHVRIMNAKERRKR